MTGNRIVIILGIQAEIKYNIMHIVIKYCNTINKQPDRIQTRRLILAPQSRWFYAAFCPRSVYL